MGYDSAVRRSIAAGLLLALIGAGSLGAAAVACGFDGVGALGVAGGPRDGSTLADVTTTGDAAGGGPGDGGNSDGGDASAPPLDGGSTSYGLRVTNGLVALYEFEEGSGSLAHDTVLAGLDLVIADPTKVTWTPHALNFNGDTALATQFALAKLNTACGLSNELTVEVWVKPAPTNGDSRTRIATMASDNAHLNFALGVDKTNAIWATVEANNDLAPATMLAPQLSHLVMTRTASDATLRLYLDGTQVTGELGSTPAPASSWALVPLFVGNSSESNRPWRGTIHLLALYSRALTPAEVATNHGAGADP